MIKIMKFWTLFVCSLGVALASVGLPYLIDRDNIPLVLMMSVPLCAGWGALLILAFKQFRWRGLWFLLGAPLVFWWPLFVAMIVVACAHNIRACP
jgi:hypothetical protein